MSIQDVKLPKSYKNKKVLYEQDLDRWRLKAESTFAVIKKNLLQIAADSFSVGYDYKNNGVAQKPVSLEDRLNAFSSGGVAFPGTISPSFSINTAGFSATLDTSLLTANRTYLFPDKSGTLALISDFDIFVPKGSAWAFNDLNGALTFDNTKFAYMNGQTVTINGTPTVLQDMSNRYFVGFGTEGGADLGSAAWNAAATGNATHQINLQHSHTVNAHSHTGAAHTHDLSNHTHTGAAHTHGPGTLVFNIGQTDGGGLNTILSLYVSGAGAIPVSSAFAHSDGAPLTGITNYLSGFQSGSVITYCTGPGTGSGATDSTTPGAGGTPSNNTSGSTTPGAGGSASPGTDSQLSTVQSIQPRSIRTRWIMRYA